MKRLVIVRHGRTEWNHIGRVQGQSDAPLDEVGLAQAARIAPVIAELEPAALWCSDLSRAVVTASLIGEAAGLAPLPDERLRERSFGDREGLTKEEYLAGFPEEFEEFRRGRYDAVPGAEKSVDAQARMVASLSELLGSVGDRETAIAVSHGAAIKLGVAGLVGMLLEEAVDGLWGMDNCAWAVVSQDSDGRCRLVAYNRTA